MQNIKNNTIFNDTTVPLVVLCDYLDDYKTADFWQDFQNITCIDPAALDAVYTPEKAEKVLREGVLLIERDGRTYNAQDALVK